MSKPYVRNLIVGQLACLAVLVSAAGQTAPLVLKRTINRTNAVQSGVSAVGTAGSGAISVAGVSGTVTNAYLYWHGFNNSGAGAVYDNAGITFNGNAVTGTSQGDASTNCWGSGSSRAFEADVTSLVSGNGTYSLSGLASAAGYRANGASLVVFFNDGNVANDRDYVIYAGNDSVIADGSFPADAAGWAASLSAIDYQGGAVRASVHVADGQSFSDGPLTFSTAAGSTTINDTSALYDGNSLPNAGAEGYNDVHTFDVTAAFGAAGPKTLTLAGAAGGDCLALNTLVVDLPAGAAPFTTCAAEGFAGSKLTLCRKICETDQTPTMLLSLIKLYRASYREDPACSL